MEGTCSLRVTRRYAATVAEVWAALTEPESAQRWLGVAGVELRTVEDGRVLELELTDSVARIELSADGDRTLLVLDHGRLPAPVGMAFMRRWTNAFERFDREVAA